MIREEATSTYAVSIDHEELGFVVQERVKISLKRPNARVDLNGRLTLDSHSVSSNEKACR